MLRVDLIKVTMEKLASDTGVTVIRADQMGDISELPYATCKILSDHKGVGRGDVQHIDGDNQLIEQRSQERNATISFNVFGISHDNAFEVAKQLRKWFEWRGSLFLDEINVALVSVSAVDNRSVFLIDAYDEKFGFDVIIRYSENDQMEIDYFDKVEYEIIIDRE